MKSTRAFRRAMDRKYKGRKGGKRNPPRETSRAYQKAKGRKFQVGK